jgi:2,3-bisphosphoglycerate-dependent phosphoglycerate mutase
MAKVLLIRHCESNGVPEPNDDLTEVGLEQARALAVYLSPFGIDRVVSSPYRRARRTIAPFLEASGLETEFDPRIAERKLAAEPFADWEEWLAFVRRTFEDPGFKHPQGESSGEALARGRAALEDALNGANQVTALVSHGQVSSIVLTSIDPSFGFDGWRAMTNPDVFEVEGSGGSLSFRRVWT